MAVVIRRKGVSAPVVPEGDALSFVGLAGLVDVLPVGSPVIVRSPRAARFRCKDGDRGVVTKHCRAAGMRDIRPADDLYFVALEGSSRVVYLTYSELVRG